MSVATDTLCAAATLTEAGVPERQAAAHAGAVDAAVAGAVGDLVTRDQLHAELATLRDQLTWRLLGGLGALLALFRLSGWLIP